MDPIATEHDARVYACDWRALLDVVPVCDLLLVDAPYSERTHAGHDDGTDSANKLVHRGKIRGREQTRRDLSKVARRSISYPYWTPDDVRAVVAAWAPRTRGWFVSITDHVLFPAWEEALMAAGRYVFSPLPYVAVDPVNKEPTHMKSITDTAAATFIGATDDEGGRFCCRECIPKLPAEVEGDQRQTCIADIHAERAGRMQGDYNIPGKQLWSGVWSDGPMADDILEDLDAVFDGEGCIHCGKLPSEVTPGPLPCP